MCFNKVLSKDELKSRLQNSAKLRPADKQGLEAVLLHIIAREALVTTA